MDASSEKRPDPNVAREPREEERDAHNNQHHNIAIEWKRRQKGKEQKKRGFVFHSLSLPQLFHLKSCESSRKFMHISQISSLIQTAGMQTQQKKAQTETYMYINRKP